MNQKISKFDSIQELQDDMEKKIQELNKKIDFQSKLIGDKIRDGEKNNSEELSDLKEKLNPSQPKDAQKGDKKSKNKKTSGKKKKSKKDKSENWIDYQGLHVYNGVGTRGELELYFKSLEEMKNEVERLSKTKESLDQLVKSGIKKELSGIGFEQQEGPFELAFIKSDSKREKFSFKSILTVECE